MLNEQTVTIMNSLKLFGMARGFADRLNDSSRGELSHAEFVGLLIQDEKSYRDNKRLTRLLKRAKLRQPASLEDIDYTHARGLTKQTMLELSDTRWIAAHRNVLITGPTGIGKSYLACALGNAAARAGYTVLYARAPRLFETLQQARGDGSHIKVLDKLTKVQLLVLDDFLLTPLSDWERRDLVEIVEGRYDAGATVVGSQCPIRDWHPAIGDPTLADAICDRLFHNASRIELKGDSMRRKRGETAEKGEEKPLKTQRALRLDYQQAQRLPPLPGRFARDGGRFQARSVAEFAGISSKEHTQLSALFSTVSK